MMSEITCTFWKQSFGENHVSFENVCRLSGSNLSKWMFHVCLKRRKAEQLLKRQPGREPDLVAVVLSVLKCHNSQHKPFWAMILILVFSCSIQRYAVIPLSTNSGLIGWVPHCDTLHALIRDYREKKKILLNIEHRIMLRVKGRADRVFGTSF